MTSQPSSSRIFTQIELLIKPNEVMKFQTKMALKKLIPFFSFLAFSGLLLIVLQPIILKQSYGQMTTTGLIVLLVAITLAFLTRDMARKQTYMKFRQAQTRIYGFSSEGIHPDVGSGDVERVTPWQDIRKVVTDQNFIAFISQNRRAILLPRVALFQADDATAQTIRNLIHENLSQSVKKLPTI